MIRLKNLVVLLRAQLWIIPSLISALALLGAYAMLSSDASLLDDHSARRWWLYSGDAGTARNLLSSLLSGLMTMTSLVVSVTFVILTLAANQLGPRLITTFMADRKIQVVLGLFLGTILYIIAVLRSLDDQLGPEGVPHAAVSLATLLTVVCLFALLFYVHMIARSIIADTVVERVSMELHSAIAEMLPEDLDGAETPEEPLRAPIQTVAVGRVGYVQTIDYDTLVSVARRHDAVLRLAVRAGHFILSGGTHAEVFRETKLDDAAIEKIRGAFIIGSERSPAQDLEFAIRQLVEIALRALSPGINDPFTAVAVVDRLGAALERIQCWRSQDRFLRDRHGTLRVIARPSDLQGLFDAALDPLRQAGASHPAVLIRMADILGQLGGTSPGEAGREAILVHLERLEEAAVEASATPTDRHAVLTRIAHARAVASGQKPL